MVLLTAENRYRGEELRTFSLLLPTPLSPSRRTEQRPDYGRMHPAQESGV